METDKTNDRLLKKIGAVKSQILELVSDADKGDAETLISELLSLQAQSDVEAVELCVPTKSVTSKYDGGSFALLDTSHGLLAQFKGGYSVFIESRMTSLCQLLRDVKKGFSNEEIPDIVDENGESLANEWMQAWMYVLQAPLFAMLAPEASAKIATLLINMLNEHAKKNIEQAELKPETPEDVEANNEFLNNVELLDGLYPNNG